MRVKTSLAYDIYTKQMLVVDIVVPGILHTIGTFVTNLKFFLFMRNLKRNLHILSNL